LGPQSNLSPPSPLAAEGVARADWPRGGGDPGVHPQSRGGGDPGIQNPRRSRGSGQVP
jgi:hypothetical protein